MTWRTPVTVLVMSVWMALWPGPAGGAPVTRGLAPAEADSLVWYVEDLEAEIKLLRIRAAAEADSLKLRLEFMGYRLQWALEDRPRWYEKPSLAFMAGAVIALVVFGQVVKVTF